ncbi:MAG TPA: hypothetical protein VKT75_19900 [Acidobacteriaceae bacterium]|nr:hypothetical protein [Acidobacteriaceae bacterium]
MDSLSPLAPVQQFIMDCVDLASSLDSLDPRDYSLYVIATVLSSQTQYHALLLRRQGLSPSSAEEAWIDFMLDSLLARLSSLKRRIGIGAPIQCISKAPAGLKAG